MTRAEINALAKKTAEEQVKLLVAQGYIKDEILGVDEVAKFLGMSKSWVYNNMRDLNPHKIGHTPKFFRSEITKFVRSK